MTKTDVAKLPGLFQRDGVYQLRTVVPLELKTAFSGKSKLVRSLGTRNYREAVLKATQERATLLGEFSQQLLALKPHRLDVVTPEMAAELAHRVRARVLRLDDSARGDPDLAAALREVHGLAAQSSLMIPATSKVPQDSITDSMSGMSAKEGETLAGLNEIRSDTAGIKLALRDLKSILSLVTAEALKLGLAFDPSAPGAKEALEQSLKAYRLAVKEATLRDAGDVVDTPTVKPFCTGPSKVTHLRDVYQRWKASEPRSPDSHNACLRSLVLFEEFTGNPSLSALTREQGDGFKAWLQHPDRKTTSKTAHDRLTWVKSLLKYACQSLELMTRNPWQGLKIPHKTTNKRRPWTDTELTTFFTQPLHTNYALPKAKQAGADAAYWIPLLGLYTGSRIGELAQLQVADVGNIGGISVLTITDDGDGQTVKTEAGIRKVPIHSELVRLGFLEFVEALKTRRESALWSSLPTRTGKAGDYFGRWFRDYRRALGFGILPDFHCLRHTVRSQMAEAEITEQMMDTVMGHEIKGSTGAKVYTHRTLAAIQKALAVVHYPALSLPRVYAGSSKLESLNG